MANRKSGCSSIRLLLVACGLVGTGQATEASPQFARQHQVRCTACHVVPPRLNEHGMAFQANGYRIPARIPAPGDRPAAAAEPVTAEIEKGDTTLPLAVWITGRFEDQGDAGASDLLLPKVELISGGTLGDAWSYFVEWRVVSLSLNADGSLRDRGGRFEDLFVQWLPSDRHALKLGQYRSLNQVDVSLRLSPGEPSLFRNALSTGDDPDPRVASLSRFSPSSRSPSVGYGFQSVRGRRAGDGLFHWVTVPFTGEFSIPLSSEASETASFELEEPKGVFVETFYRTGHRSLGAHAFVESDTWLFTVLGTYDWKNLFATIGVGVDDPGFGDTRERASLEAEYLFARGESLRAAAGLRVEDVSGDGSRTAYVPYIAVAGPNTQHTLLLQIQYESREGDDTLAVDFSLLF